MLIPLGDETKQIQELIQYADGNKQIVIRAIRAYKEKQRNNDKPFTLSTPESKRQIKQYIDQLKK